MLFTKQLAIALSIVTCFLKVYLDFQLWSVFFWTIGYIQLCGASVWERFPLILILTDQDGAAGGRQGKKALF